MQNVLFFGETELRVLCLCNGYACGQTKMYHERVLSSIDAKSRLPDTVAVVLV